jgi:hypothetical protein
VVLHWCKSLSILNSRLWLYKVEYVSLCVLLNKVPDSWAGVFIVILFYFIFLLACDVSCLLFQGETFPKYQNYFHLAFSKNKKH